MPTVAFVVCAVIDVWADSVDRGRFAPPSRFDPGSYALWALLIVICARGALRRVVLGPGGVVLVGFLRNRKVDWRDVAEVEMAQRTGGTSSRGGRWRIALRMRDGSARWVESFVHGAMARGREMEIMTDARRYGRTHTASQPADAPRELLRLHAALRGYWLAAVPVPEGRGAVPEGEGGRR
uniref:PH domain-containing protein n=1 Tax=Streptomyces sp. NBC_01401 TaxID=2903854 RepID=A0AAU3GR66_9ACTN